MSWPKGSILSEIVSKHESSIHGAGSSTTCVLKCGHAATVNSFRLRQETSRTKGARLVCAVCTKTEARKAAEAKKVRAAIPAPAPDLRDQLIAELRKKVARLEGMWKQPEQPEAKERPPKPGPEDSTIRECSKCRTEGFVASDFGWKWQGNRWVGQSQCRKCRMSWFERERKATALK